MDEQERRDGERSVRLQVASAKPQDVGRGVARVDHAVLRRLGVREGEIIEIIGKRSTAAIAVPPYPEDEGLRIIRLDGLERANADVGIGDSVEIRRADVRPARLRFEGPSLYVDDIYIMNVGSPEAREQVLRWGRAYLLRARSEEAAAKLSHPGQRQAILHDVCAVLGTRKDLAMPELTPMIRQQVETGDLGVYVTPAVGDDGAVMAVIRRVPLLESARGSDPGGFDAGGSRREG